MGTVYTVDGQTYQSHDAMVTDTATRPRPAPDGGVCDLVADYGAVPASVDPKADNTTVIQRAIDHMVAGRFAVLWTPPGLYRHHGVHLDISADGSTRVHLQGAGRRLSKWQCLSDTDTNLTLTTPTGNARDCTITDMTFTSGSTALSLSRASYNLFRGCTFENTKAVAVEVLAASNNNTFDACWWVHNQGESLNVSNGRVNLTGCIIGEDTGHIQNNGTLILSGCLAHSSASKLEPKGPRGMGRCLVFNTGNGTLIASGCDLTSNFNLMDMRFSNRVILSGNNLSCGGSTDSALLMMDDPHASGSSLVMTGNHITLQDGDSLYSSWGGAHLTNSIITGNVIELAGPTYAVTLAEALEAPELGNRVDGNLIRRRVA